ncbi:MAG: hypothetical protein H0W88_07485 [Parachlamydiaceae bacterium]|nr:hypothetical protein [Parachlamydiaceae bacterium]
MITATNYEDRLHVGYGEENSVSKCFGRSINVYQNFITKTLTKLFGISIEVNIDGINRCVNRNSFRKHLYSIGLKNISVDDIKMVGYKTIINRNEDKLIKTEDNLWESFSEKKRLNLFNKMVNCLLDDDTEGAKRMIRKGAFVDREFFTTTYTEFNGVRFWNSRTGCERNLDWYMKSYSNISGKYFSYTPLTLAAEKGHQSLAKLILNHKKGEHSSDQLQTFNYSPSTSGGSYTNWNRVLIKSEPVSINQGKVKLIKT